MLKQSGNRLEAAVGMKMQKTFLPNTFFDYSFTVIKNHHGFEFSGLENVYLLRFSFCLSNMFPFRNVCEQEGGSVATIL